MKSFTIEMSAAQIAKIQLGLRALPTEPSSDEFDTDSATDLIEMFDDVLATPESVGVHSFVG